jgi:helix-hairpin-helix protein
MSENPNLDLADIPGLGPVRRAALAEAGVHDLQGLLAMKVAELAAVRGIGVWQARKIREFLRQRGLLFEVEDGTGDIAVIMVPPQTAAEAEAVAEAVDMMETQAATEARVEAEVELLTEAVRKDDRPEGTRRMKDEGGLTTPDSSSTDGEAPMPQAPDGNGRMTGEPAQAEAESQEDASLLASSFIPHLSDEWREQVRSHREQLPEAAVALIEAIRQAAVSKQLTRQLTRLLITSGEFLSDSRPLAPEQLRQASKSLMAVERALQRAVERGSFRPSDQKDLANRIRKRRKELERFLERE